MADRLYAAKQTYRQIQRAEVALGADKHRREFVHFGIVKSGAAQHSVEHRIAVNGAGGADFAQFRQLEPQALHELIRLLGIQRAAVDIALEVRQQRLVRPFRVDCIAAVIQLERQLEQIERLAGFFEITRWMGRHVVENGCAIEQLGFAISIGLRRRQLLGAVGQILRQRQQGVAGVDGGAAAVDFIHTAAADRAAECAGFLFQLVLNRQHPFFDHQPVVRRIQIAIEVEELESRWATGRVFVMENRPVRFTALVADNEFIGADGQRQLAHQFIETARRFNGGGNARDIAIQGVQRGGMFGAQRAFLGE